MDNQKLRVALYLRLSDEDHDKLDKNEWSESIKNQEMMLKDYAEEQGWKVVLVYNDEDYSGADRDRPNFNKMIQACESGLIDIVLVKTQARFARDIELIDKYVHNKFYEWNIRFMTYIEKIDNSKRETKKTSQITGMIDEWYVEDTSINIRETLKTKRENGEFTGSFTPYGYIKDPENKNHLVIDPIAALTVKRIYEEYLKGFGIQTIAKHLNLEDIPSPLEYKRLNGCKLQIPLTKKYENNLYIEKAGTFKIDIFYHNHQKKEIKNMIIYNYLTKDNKNFDSKCDIILKDYAREKMKIYFTNIPEINKNLFFINDWIPLNINDKIPKDTTCIAIFVPTLNYTHSLYYQFEVILKENRKHNKYFFLTEEYIDGKKANLDFEINIKHKHRWSPQTIKKILTNEFYIGNLVQFKSTYVSYKNHTIIHNDPSKWIKVTNTHDAIIKKEIWDDVQNRMKEKTRSTKKGIFHPFANKVFCMNCNRVFCKCGKNNKNGFSYLCCKDKKEKWRNCNNQKYLSEEELHILVFHQFNQLLKKYFKLEDLIELEKASEKYSQNQNNSLILEKEINNYQKEIKNKQNYFKSLYEDYKRGILTKKEFFSLKMNYQNDIDKFENRISNLEKEINMMKKKLSIPINIRKEFQKYSKINTLNNDLINTFIDKILVDSYNEQENSRKIKIIWNFII